MTKLYIMKARKQILEWLRSQPWYDLFEKNYVNDYGNGTIDYYVNSLKNFEDRIIICAFRWTLCPGFDFWSEIDKEYRKWLYE